jgi:hypothetical protein
MKKIYFLLIPVPFLVLLTGCLALNYRDKIAATWELTEVKISKRDQADSMMFMNGVFRFYSSGNLEYKDRQGHTYSGTWKIKDQRIYTGENSSRTDTNLFITLVDFNNHELKTEIFDDIIFTGPDKFRAYLERKGRNTFYFSKLQ